jgi:CBS domain-containing protein
MTPTPTSVSVIFLFLVLIAIVLRLRRGITPNVMDFAFAGIPIIIWLVMSGYVEKIKISNVVDLEIKTAFVQAYKAPVAKQVSALIRSGFVAAAKGYAGQLDYLVGMRPDALVLDFCHGKYDVAVMTKYFDKMGKASVKYVVFTRRDDFLAMIDFSDFVNQCMSDDSIGIDRLVGALNDGDPGELFGEFRRLVTKEYAITKDTSKHQALINMEKCGADFLPVVSGDSLSGVLLRSRVTSSLLLDVVGQIGSDTAKVEKNL